MKNFKYPFIIILAVVSLWSCSEDLLDTTPNDRISKDIFWKTDQDATYAANAVYTFLENAGDFIVWDAMSDIGHLTLQWRDESIMEKGSYDATLSIVYNRWSNAYSGIQTANIFLDKVGLVKTTNQALIDRLTMEVRVLRAYCYINLAFLYGDVPLVITETTLESSRKLTRTPVAQVWDFISTELTEAAAGLPNIQTEKGRITKGAALALKARAMLYAGRYTDAATAAKAVMDLGVYSLYPSYEKLFSYEAEGSSEVILDRQYVKDVLSNNIFNLATPNSIWPQINWFVPTKSGVDAYPMINGKEISDPTSGFDPLNPYSNRDPRLKFSVYTLGDILPNNKVYDPRPTSGTGDAIGSSENSTYSGFNVKKYLNKEDMAQPGNCGINIILLRYAEVLLTYAEAMIEANQIDQSVVDAINLVRTRSDVAMPVITGIPSQIALRKIVREERSVELAFEGLRYFDIRRWRIAETVIPGIIYGMTYVDQSGSLTTIALTGFNKAFDKNRDYIWPIPQRERELNPNLVQNSNW